MRQLDQLHNDMIWLSIVGVTDQYLQNHISHSSYAVCYTEILSTVMSLNLQDEECWMHSAVLRASIASVPILVVV